MLCVHAAGRFSQVFPLGRLIEEVSPCSMSLDEPWSLDTDCTSLVSRKSGSFEEFLQETRLSESDIWRMLANQQQQLTVTIAKFPATVIRK